MMIEQSEIRTRNSAIQVGDLIQYRYHYSKLGSALETRAVIEVINDGACFVVEGFYNVWANQITAHIAMNDEPPETLSPNEWLCDNCKQVNRNADIFCIGCFEEANER